MEELREQRAIILTMMMMMKMMLKLCTLKYTANLWIVHFGSDFRLSRLIQFLLLSSSFEKEPSPILWWLVYEMNQTFRLSSFTSLDTSLEQESPQDLSFQDKKL